MRHPEADRLRFNLAGQRGLEPGTGLSPHARRGGRASLSSTHSRAPPTVPVCGYGVGNCGSLTMQVGGAEMAMDLGAATGMEQPWNRGGFADNLVQHVTVVVPG